MRGNGERPNRPVNRRRRRLILILVAVVVLALIAAPVAFAAAGGGSSGFGGGGGGGEGGGGGGGKGFAIYIIFRAIFDALVFGNTLVRVLVIGLIVLVVLVVYVGPRVRRWRESEQQQGRAATRETAKRERRTELAAAEAADEDPMFDPDNVRAAATRLFTEIQAAWSADDRNKLRALVAPELLGEWERRLDDLARRGWRNRVQVIGEPHVQYVGLQRRGDGTDRVTVRIEAKLRDYVEDGMGRHIKRSGRPTETVQTREFWTLTKRAGNWILASIEQGSEGAHALSDELVATPWSDDQALKDETLVEQAVADAVPETTKIADLADLDFDGDARAAALDLSVADGRFAPDLLEIAARRAVAAWALAIDGSDAGLENLATAQATRELLHPGDPSERTRLVVRGPRIEKIRIASLDAAAVPPTMTIDVDLKGRRYIEDRSTTQVVAGNALKETAFTEHWTLALDGDAAHPWRIVAVGSPVANA
jgi:predicted lipid-binding transport protein (Tim44 family)